MLQVVQAHSNILKNEIYFVHFFISYDFYQVLESKLYVLLEQSEKTEEQELPNLRRSIKPYPRNLAAALTTVVMAKFW